VVGRGVEPAAAFVVARVVGRNSALADRALLRVEGFQPRARGFGHPGRNLAASGFVVADHACVGHAGNLTRQRAARIPLFRIRRASC